LKIFQNNLLVDEFVDFGVVVVIELKKHGAVNDIN
jgi:hypothetical protein